MKQNKTASYGMLVGAMLVFGTIGIFRRYIPLSSGLLAGARGFLGALVLALFVKAKGGRLRHGIGRKKLLLLALSGGLMGANWILLFEAYRCTTVSVATLCYYMEPTIVILLSPLLFGERLTPKKLACAAVSVVGMALVSGIGEGGQPIGEVKGLLFGLGAAALYASVVIMNKKVQIEDAYEKTVIQLFSAAVTILPYLLLTEDFSGLSLSPFAVVMVLVVGVVHTGLAYALYFGGMAALPAQSIAVLSYLDPVSALLLSALILGERLTALGLLGAVLVIGAALFSEVEGNKKD